MTAAKQSRFSKPSAQTLVLEDVVKQIREGYVRVPNFQRGLKWQFKDVHRLFDSIWKGYPIGSLLFWERPAKRKQKIRLGALTISAPAGAARWIIDGQQRVTSLANALTKEGHDDSRFALAFDLERDEFTKPRAASHVIPLYELFDLQQLIAWFSARPELDKARQLSKASEVAKVIREYTIPAYVVDDPNEEVLREIFDRLNNTGRRLSRAEVFSGLHAADQAGAEGKKGAPVKLEAIAPSVQTQTGFGRIDDDTILRAILARRGADMTREVREEFKEGVERDVPPETPEAAYRAGEEAIVRAITFLQRDAGVPHFGFLPYRYLVVVLTRFFAHFPRPKARNLLLLRRWFWRAALVGPNVSRGSWTGAMGALSSKIKPDEESGSVNRLLRALEGAHQNYPQITRFRTNQADSRTFLCALWSLQPRSVLTGEPYDLSELTGRLGDESSARGALFAFFQGAPAPDRNLAANWALAFEDRDLEAWPKRHEGIDKGRWQDVLRSHALDGASITGYRADHSKAFFNHRQRVLEELLKSFLERMTEEQLEDTPSLDDLVLDDDQSRDDADEVERG